MTINDLVARAFANAQAKGFWDDCARRAHERQWEDTDPAGLDRALVEAKIPEKLMLVVTEAAEAMEDYRTGKLEEYFEESGKPCGLPSELADIVLRVADMCGAAGYDLQGAIIRKLDYNEKRSFRHGNKRC